MVLLMTPSRRRQLWRAKMVTFLSRSRGDQNLGVFPGLPFLLLPRMLYFTRFGSLESCDLLVQVCSVHVHEVNCGMMCRSEGML